MFGGDGDGGCVWLGGLPVAVAWKDGVGIRCSEEVGIEGEIGRGRGGYSFATGWWSDRRAMAKREGG